MTEDLLRNQLRPSRRPSAPRGRALGQYEDGGFVMGWQPIETAPKDGTRIILWRGCPEFGAWAELVIAEWLDGEWCWPDPRQNPRVYGDWSHDDLTDGYAATESFTHWMPMPDPPSEARK